MPAIDFRKYYAAVQSDLRWQTLEPYADPATRQHLLPYIGRAFHDGLVSALAGANPSAEILEAGQLARQALAQFLVWDAAPHQLSNLSALGFQSMSDREGTSRLSPQWVYFETRRQLMLKGGENLDHLLAFLDQQVAEGNADFDLYADDPARQYKRSDFFRAPEELEAFYSITGNRRAFNRIVPHLRDAERRKLSPILGTDFYTEVRALPGNVARTQVQDELVERIHRYVAQAGMIAALPYLTSVITGDGIQIVSSTDGFRSRKSDGESHSQAVTILQQESEARANEAERDLVDFLNNHLTDFPIYATNRPVGGETNQIINTGGAVGFF